MLILLRQLGLFERYSNKKEASGLRLAPLIQSLQSIALHQLKA
jgi:hypothetical protein